MDGVRVQDVSGKVLYVFEAVGDTVSIGRDKKKCGIALPVDAQGVSRIHGSLTWSNKSELSFCDSSTYGTVVDGTLVKDRAEVVRDGAHIFVGDVELVVSFPQQSLRLDISSSDSLSASRRSVNTKRKGAGLSELESESKRPKVSRAKKPASRQSEMSSFLVKKPLVVDDDFDDDDCQILAEDTPLSQRVDSPSPAAEKAVSFVKDSMGKSTSSFVAPLSNKSDNRSSTSAEQPQSSTVRRKKQSIFAPKKHLASTQFGAVIAEDTQQKVIPSPIIEDPYAISEDRSVSNLTTCIPDTCGRKSKILASTKHTTSTGLGVVLAEDTQFSGKEPCVVEERSVRNTTTCIPDTCLRKEGVLAASNTSVSSQFGAVLAEDTDLNMMSSSISNEPRGMNGNQSVNTTSIPDTCGQKDRSTRDTSNYIAEMNMFPNDNSTLCRPSATPKMSAFSVDAPTSLSGTCTATSTMTRRTAQGKKMRIFNPLPVMEQQTFMGSAASISALNKDFIVESSKLRTTSRYSSSFAHQSTTVENQAFGRLNGTGNEISASSDISSRRFSTKTSTVGPVSVNSEESAKNTSDEMDEPVGGPELKDILKLVSTGKRYDVGDDEEDAEDEKGLEIERVVAKLSELVHYADIERPRRPAVANGPKLDVSSSNSANFKRFRKARQGRFNASLSSANLSCVIGGNDDLVDFRQLPQAV